jgi:crotonobetaine/carnitine-CoA ligase
MQDAVVEAARGEEVRLPQLIAARAAAQPDRAFLQHVDGSSLTYGELLESSLRWASLLEGLGVGRGDRVVVMLPICLEAVPLWIGVGWLGAIEVPINTDLKMRSLVQAVENLEARAIVTAEALAARFEKIGDQLPEPLPLVIVDGAGEAAPSFRTLDARAQLPRAEPTPREGPEPHDIASIMYTSGTTGPPSGVMQTWTQWHETALGLFPEGAVGEDDCWYLVHPVYHVTGKVPIYLMAARNGRVVMRSRYRTQDFWNDVKEHGCSVTILLIATLHFLQQQPESPEDRDTPLNKALVAPLPDRLDEFRERFGIEICTTYNMTEISIPICSQTFELPNNSTCGRVRPGHQVRIVDDEDRPLGPGEVGEIVIRTDDPWKLMVGYWKRPEKTVETWRNLWLHTGDLARYDEDGWFYYVDRKKDSIRRRGENISSMEVEAEVNGFPTVFESAAVAVASELGEDEVKVYVVPHEGEEIDPAELTRFLIERMPRFMVPRYLEFVAALPRTESTLKVQKGVLREQGINEMTWDREAAGIKVPRD